MMGRYIDTAVIHCSATREGVDIDAATIKQWHITPQNMGGRGWSDIGYHYIVRLDGTIERGRPIDKVGAHAQGHNNNSVGIVYVGGLDKDGLPKDTRTRAQKHAIIVILEQLIDNHPIKEIAGHRDLSPDLDGDGIVEPWEWMKSCPCFDAKNEYYELLTKGN